MCRFGSPKGAMDTRGVDVGFVAGEAPTSVHQSQEDMGEVRA